MVQRSLIEKIVLVVAVLLVANMVVGGFFGMFLGIGYFSGKSVPRIVSDLAFVEGAFAFFGGGLLAFVSSHVSLRSKAMMIIGASLIGTSLLFGVFA